MEDFKSEQDLQDAIVLKVFDGDESAITDMLIHYGPRLEKSLARRFQGKLTAEDIEEILSDALRKFWSFRAKYDDKKCSIRWLLYVIARRRARDVLRAGWRKAKGLELDIEKEFMELQYADERHVNASVPDDPPPNETDAKRDQAVRDTLAEMHEVQRQILEHDALAEDEIDATELGRRLGGIPGGTIRVYRTRAKEAFQKGMKKRGYDVRPTEERDAE
jgi:RNA polymerase sigma factor (sigma-70 family)